MQLNHHLPIPKTLTVVYNVQQGNGAPYTVASFSTSVEAHQFASLQRGRSVYALYANRR